MLAPGDPEAPAQLVDVRDLADWLVRCAEERTTGTFNATGEPTTVSALLETIRDTLASSARFTWVADEILVKHDVGAYSEMPFWLPASLGARRVPIARALAQGLCFRSLSETIRDTWDWLKTGWDEESNARAQKRLKISGGMTEERETLLLQASEQEAALQRK